MTRVVRSLRLAALVGTGVLLAACGPSAPDESEPPTEGSPAFVPEETPPAEFSRSSDASQPGRFGVGRTPGPDEIARLDIDVLPDGTGLPPGSATAAEGEAVYAARCASCHGVDGRFRVPGGGVLVAEGDKHAFVDGSDPGAYGKRTVGNYWPYATTLFDYVRRAMPLDRPGSLTDDEVYAVVAWILWKNELVGREAVIDRATLPEVEMPARDRFVPDPRLRSARVR